MLTKDKNREMTDVGKGTPAGNLLRQYWTPIAQSVYVQKEPALVTVLGERLVLFRNAGNQVFLVSERCPHRGTSLAGGRVEERGIRCCYHGWLFDGSGQCIEQPGEPADSTFYQKAKIASYPVVDRYGFIWAFMGSGDPPVLPPYDVLAREDGKHWTTEFDWDCNYLQVVENLIDPVHTTILHIGTSLEKAYEGIPEMRFEETPRGMRSHAGRPGYLRQAEMLFPTAIRQDLPFMNPSLQLAFWVVPLDDRRTRSYHAWFLPLSEESDPQTTSQLIEKAERFIFDIDPHNRKNHSSKVIMQDKFAAESQGPIVDRSNELLGTSDVGVILFRKLFQEAMEAVRQGRDPRGMIREHGEGVIVFDNVK